MPAKKKKRILSKSTQPKNEEAKKSPIIASNNAPSKRINKYYVVVALLSLILLSVLFFKGFLVAATVNGKPISRFTVIGELEKQSGQKVLDSLITEALVKEAAEKQNITVTDSELNEELANIEKSLKAQGQDFNQVLVAQGLTREKLKEQIKIQKIVEKLFAKDIQVSDKEVQDFIDKNKELMPEGSSDAQIQEQTKTQLEQSKLNEKFQSWIATQRTNAKIHYFVKY